MFWLLLRCISDRAADQEHQNVEVGLIFTLLVCLMR